MTSTPNLFEARNTDPVTSHESAAALDHTLRDHHRYVLSWLRAYGPATDDDIADAMVGCGRTDRHETARRWVRTLRERHELIVPEVDDHGDPLTALNRSGRSAILWRAAP
jgi:hypothetical protein